MTQDSNKMQDDRDKFDVTNGNIMVLSNIPKMMTIPKWRKKIRGLVLDYILEGRK